MSLTMRWSEAGYLSQFVLAHALRQASVSLILGVRQNDENHPSCARPHTRSSRVWDDHHSIRDLGNRRVSRRR
jgi:hypothetical protein